MQELLFKSGNQSLPLSEQEFYELRMDDLPEPDSPGFVIVESRASWNDTSNDMILNEIEKEHWATYETAKNRYMARRQLLAEKGFTESDLDF